MRGGRWGRKKPFGKGQQCQTSREGNPGRNPFRNGCGAGPLVFQTKKVREGTGPTSNRKNKTNWDGKGGSKKFRLMRGGTAWGSRADLLGLVQGGEKKDFSLKKAGEKSKEGGRGKEGLMSSPRVVIASITPFANWKVGVQKS